MPDPIDQVGTPAPPVSTGTPVTISTPPPRARRDFLDKLVAIIQVLGSTALVTIAGYFFTYSGTRLTAETTLDVKRQEGQVKVLEVALDILRSAPKENGQDKLVRDWATRVVTQYVSDDVKVDQATLEQFEKNAIPSASPNPTKTPITTGASGQQPGTQTK